MLILLLIFSSSFSPSLKIGGFCCNTINLGSWGRHLFLVKTISGFYHFFFIRTIHELSEFVACIKHYQTNFNVVKNIAHE
jgi:hypothetical protein